MKRRSTWEDERSVKQCNTETRKEKKVFKTSSNWEKGKGCPKRSVRRETRLRTPRRGLRRWDRDATERDSVGYDQPKLVWRGTPVEEKVRVGSKVQRRVERVEWVLV